MMSIMPVKESEPQLLRTLYQMLYCSHQISKPEIQGFQEQVTDAIS